MTASHPPFDLRVPTHEDLWAYVGFLARPEVRRWLDDDAQRPVIFSDVEAFAYRNTWATWSVDCGGDFVGLAGFSNFDAARGVGRFYIVLGDEAFWGKGLGTAVAKRVVEVGFVDLGLRKISSDYLAPNAAAAKVHERAGFAIDGRLRDDAWRQGRWVDRVLASILRDEHAGA